MKEIRSDPIKSDNCMKPGHLHGNFFPLWKRKKKTQVEQICFNFILTRMGKSELPLKLQKEENRIFENHITFYCRLLHTLVVKMARLTTKNRKTVLIAGAQALLCRVWMEKAIIMMAPATNQD